MNVYRILHTASGKSYIGKNTHRDSERRWKRHQREASDPTSDVYNTHFHRALRKYGFDAFEFSTIAVARSHEELTQLETKFIQELKTDNPRYGYNSTTGGEATSYNNTARKNMSAAQKQVWAKSPDRKIELSRRASGENNNFYGANHSKENNPFHGRAHSTASKLRISKSKKGTGTSPRPKMSEAGRTMWENDPERRERQREQNKARWADPAFKERMKALFASEEFKKKCNPHKTTPPSAVVQRPATTQEIGAHTEQGKQ